jgi:glycosyltransferase involved in cell wall biosynthesis
MESSFGGAAMQPALSVVAPCRDEVENLPEFLREATAALSAVGEYEILVVDDGSRDGSLDLLVKLKAEYPRLRVIALDGRHGKTSALDAGFKAARGAVVATIDADLQDDPADIPKMMEHLKQFDAVNGRRAKREDTGLRRLSSKVANAIRNRLSGENVVDSASGLKVYKRECLANLKLFHGLHRFMPTLVKMEGFTVGEVPINNRPRTRGTAKYGFWNRVFAAFWDLLAVRWMKQRMLRHKGREV